MDSVRVLLTSIVDYAGLFPPSGLPMERAVDNYAAYRDHAEAWMLGRLIVPFARIDELERVAAPRFPTDPAAEPWGVSAIVGADLDAEIDAIFGFNRRYAGDDGGGRAVIDTIELKADGPRSIERALRIIPEQLTPFFEAPHDSDLRGLITAIAGTGARAKIRCGGITRDLFPSCEHLADFICVCAAADVAFKATAGLHHPVRAEHALTYEDGAPRGVMHGFLNVFLASAFVRRAGMSRDEAVELLADDDPAHFAFEDDHARWRDWKMDAARLSSVRESFAIGFGSCSFEEPVADLRAMGALA
jgi:hypothetical protein